MLCLNVFSEINNVLYTVVKLGENLYFILLKFNKFRTFNKIKFKYILFFINILLIVVALPNFYCCLPHDNKSIGYLQHFRSKSELQSF